MRQLLLIRHAERPAIAPDKVGNEVTLTEKGKADTFRLGKTITEPVLSICSSPIDRCLQTAQILAECTSYPISDIRLDQDLGDPGFIISDGEQAWKHWQEKGHNAVNAHLLSGHDVWHGFADLNQACNAFAAKIEFHLRNNNPGLHIWVTHDTVLATFASRILNQRLTLEQWPDFLGSLSVTLDNNRLSYSYSPTLVGGLIQ